MRSLATGLVALLGGPWLVGSDDPWLPGPGEGPARPVLDPFAIGRCAVSVADFAAFVADTGHSTTAKRRGWSFVSAARVDAGADVTAGSSAGASRRAIAGATWATPPGREPGYPDHPAVHVSWDDARAYSAWAGPRLPTEAEREYAAAGGSPGTPSPWGDELEPAGEHRCNVRQQAFPTEDTGADRHYAHAPRACCSPATAPAAHVQKGGSHLCHASYCARYRIHARIGSPADSTPANAGFRIARDAA